MAASASPYAHKALAHGTLWGYSRYHLHQRQDQSAHGRGGSPAGAVCSTHDATPMNNSARRKLCEIVSANGLSLVRNAVECEKAIAEACSKYRTEVFLLVAALKAGVVPQLLSAQADMSLDAAVRKIGTKLHKNLAIVQEAAEWAVASWAAALGLLEPEEELRPGSEAETAAAGHDAEAGQDEVATPTPTAGKGEPAFLAVGCPNCEVPLTGGVEGGGPVVCPNCHWRFVLDESGEITDCHTVIAKCLFDHCGRLFEAHAGQAVCPGCDQAYKVDGHGKVLGGLTECPKCARPCYYPKYGGWVECGGCSLLWVADAEGLFKAGLDANCPQCGGGLHLTVEGVIECYRCSAIRLELDGEGRLRESPAKLKKCDKCDRDTYFTRRPSFSVPGMRHRRLRRRRRRGRPRR